MRYSPSDWDTYTSNQRKEFYLKPFEELTKEERIQLALEEVDWIVIGGQDGQEFYGSIQFIRKVLRSLV